METENEEMKKIVFKNKISDETKDYFIPNNLIDSVSSLGIFVCESFDKEEIKNLEIIVDERVGQKEISKDICNNLVRYDYTLRYFMWNDKDKIFFDEKALLLLSLSILGIDNKKIRFESFDTEKLSNSYKKTQI
jgi:hypothetical protein